MKSGPVLLLLIAFGVLYLAGTGRLASIVKALQQMDGDPSTGWDAGEAGAPDIGVDDVSRIPDYIGGIGGRGLFDDGRGWMTA